MSNRWNHKRNVSIDVDVDLYDALESWKREDFEEYFKYSHRDFDCNEIPFSSEEYRMDYDLFAWEFARGNIDKSKILAILEQLNSNSIKKEDIYE